MDVRSGSDSSSSMSHEEDVDDHVDPPRHTSRGRDESPFSRVVRRRTRLSLDRERRRLDRVPRSQRLSQVKGHPLGGMTLLQLEERHLLDIGMGQMARRLEKRQGRRGRGVRQSNEDLLRRSARLLRRAQEERDARISFENARDLYHSRHASGGEPLSSRAPRNKTSGGGARPRSAGGEGTKLRGGRPASASRDRSNSCRFVSSSLSSQSGRGGVRDRAYTASDCISPSQMDSWDRALDDVPPVGLYSGGGTRCSLKQRRPMSAKPALTCGSGWEPGRARTRGRGCSRGRGGGNGNGRWDCFEGGDPRGTPFRGGEWTAAGGGGMGGRGEEDEGSDYSDMSDLSAQGIVEYTDEEEGPFK